MTGILVALGVVMMGAGFLGCYEGTPAGWLAGIGSILGGIVVTVLALT